MALALFLSTAPGSARDIEGIAAVVNDQVISLYDVDQRVDLFFATSGIQKSPEMTERMREQVLRSLVDEKLQMQEATRVEIQIEEQKFERKDIEIGISDGINVEIISGLTIQDKIKVWNKTEAKKLGEDETADQE